MVLFIVGIVVGAVVGYEAKAHLASGTLAKIKAELVSAEKSASAPVRTLVARIKSVL